MLGGDNASPKRGDKLLMKDRRSLRSEVKLFRNKVRERGNKKALFELQDNRETPNSIKNAKNEKKGKDKVDTNGLQGRQHLQLEGGRCTAGNSGVNAPTESQLKVKTDKSLR